MRIHGNFAGYYTEMGCWPLLAAFFRGFGLHRASLPKLGLVVSLGHSAEVAFVSLLMTFKIIFLQITIVLVQL